MTDLENAQAGLALIKAAITNILKSRSYGLMNGEISKELRLESDQDGKQKNYLVWSILGLMMKEGSVVREKHQRPGEKRVSEIYKLKL